MSYGYPLAARGLSVVTNVSVFVLNVRYAEVISVLIIIATQKHKMTGTNKFQACWFAGLEAEDGKIYDENSKFQTIQ